MIFHLIVDISQYLDAIFSIISYRKIILSCILDLDIGFDTALTPAGKMERIIRGDEPEVKVCCPGGVRAVYRNHLVRLQGVSAFIIFPEGISHSIRLVARVMLPPLLSERTAGSTACVESSLKPIISVLVSAATILLLSIETE